MGLLDTLLPGLERERIRNEMKREELSALKRRRSAVSDIQGILSNGNNPQAPLLPTNSPVAQNRIMSLLGDVNPDAMAQGLLGSMGPQRQPADLKMMQALGIPETPEGYAQFKQMSSQTDPAQQLEMTQLQVRIADMMRQYEQEGVEMSQAKAVGKANAESMLNDGMNMLKYLTKLEGTALETGIPLPEFRQAMASGFDSLMSLFGEDPAVGREVRTYYDLLKKGMDRFAAKEAIRASVGGSPTDAARASAAAYSPNISMMPDANRNVIASMMQDIIQQGSIKGYDIQADKYLPMIETVLNPAQISVEQIPGFDKWSDGEKKRARIQWLGMSNEEKAAFLDGS